jgi:hypothetical protein
LQELLLLGFVSVLFVFASGVTPKDQREGKPTTPTVLPEKGSTALTKGRNNF